MKMRVTGEPLWQYAHGIGSPHPSPYLGAFDDIQAVLDRYEILDRPLRLAHFAAQMMHESWSLRYKEESFRYSAATLLKKWPKLFGNGGNDPVAYALAARNGAEGEARIANLVYNGRYGNKEPGDGYKYRGRGLLQLTFRSGYEEVSKVLNGPKYGNSAPNLVDLPDIAADPKWALEVAAAIWTRKNCNVAADHDNLDRVTRLINGGDNGIAERRRWLGLMKDAYHVNGDWTRRGSLQPR